MARDESKEALASYIGWRLQMGRTWGEALQDLLHAFPQQSELLYEEARELAQELAAATLRYRGMDPSEQLIEAYDIALPITESVGVRYAVKFSTTGGGEVWRTYAIDVPLTATKQQIDAMIQAMAERDLEDKYESYLAVYRDSGAIVSEPINLLTTPLPNRIP